MNEQAITLMKRGKPREAIEILRRDLSMRPNNPAAHVNLAIAYEDTGDAAMAERGYRFVLNVWPAHVEAASNLANLLARSGRLDEAEAMHRGVLAQRPDDVYSLTGLAMVQADQGKIEDCLANLKRAAELTGHPAAWSEYLSYGLHVGYDAEGHRQWAERFAGPLWQAPPILPYDGKRPIHVGYVSNTWGRHSVDAFILPILEAHDPAAVHVTLFSDIPTPPAIRDAADESVDTRGMNVYAFNTAVRGRTIDVLIDLDGHKHGSRLVCLGTNPAPVCGTMNGYLPDTGLTENFNLGWAFRPQADAPGVSPLPADRNGFVTFGSINRACKITPAVAGAWAAILSAVPTARLVVTVKGGEANGSVRARLEAAGVPKGRLTLATPHASPGEYRRALGAVDIHLDPWPFNGVTTTCDAMYQGVPTITRRTSERQGQVGAELMDAIGLPELVAGDDAEYVGIAADLADDVDRLRAVRASLRDRMVPLLDGVPLARRLESLYRDRVSAPQSIAKGSPATSTLTWAAHGAAGIARAVTGTGGADKATIEARNAICAACDRSQVVAGLIRRCRECGCAVWAKIRNKDEHCPLTPPKW